MFYEHMLVGRLRSLANSALRYIMSAKYADILSASIFAVLEGSCGGFCFFFDFVFLAYV